MRCLKVILFNQFEKLEIQIIEGTIFEFLSKFSIQYVYPLLFLTSFLENVFPPFPGDTVTVFGAYLVGRGKLNWTWVYWMTVLGNFSSASIFYYWGRYKGRDYVQRSKNKWINKKTISKLEKWYHRFGSITIFASRLLPGFRSAVPLFAGLADISFFRMTPPLLGAILLWHFLLLQLGSTVGREWEEIVTFFDSIQRTLLIVSIVLGIMIAIYYFYYQWSHARNNNNGSKM